MLEASPTTPEPLILSVIFEVVWTPKKPFCHKYFSKKMLGKALQSTIPTKEFYRYLNKAWIIAAKKPAFDLGVFGQKNRECVKDFIASA